MFASLNIRVSKKWRIAKVWVCITAEPISLSSSETEHNYRSYLNAVAQILLLTCLSWVTSPYNKKWDWKVIDHREEMYRPSFTFLKLLFKEVPVMKYMSQMHYRNQLDKNPNGFGIFTTDNWLCSDLTGAFPQGWAEHTHISINFLIQPHVYTLPMEFTLLCAHIPLLRVTKLVTLVAFLKDHLTF